MKLYFYSYEDSKRHNIESSRISYVRRSQNSWDLYMASGLKIKECVPLLKESMDAVCKFCFKILSYKQGVCFINPANVNEAEPANGNYKLYNLKLEGGHKIKQVSGADVDKFLSRYSVIDKETKKQFKEIDKLERQIGKASEKMSGRGM